MSCHSRHGFKATTRIAAHLTGAERRDVQVMLHALRAEATGADLPNPSAADVNAWHQDTLMEIEQSNLPVATKDKLAAALAKARHEPTDGRDFYVQRALVARVRQQELVNNTPGIVGLGAPGSQADQYELGADGRPAKVWYASYGSNLYGDRFNCYIDGGSPNGGKTQYAGSRDKTAPEGSIPVALPGTVHYAGDSSVWSGGVAFLDETTPGRSLGRAYKISAEQFDDVVSQESNSSAPPDGTKVDTLATIAHGRSVGNGVYGTLVHVGDYQGAPVMTFTSPFTARQALRGDMVYTPQNTLTPAADRTAERAAQAAAQAAENTAAEQEKRPPKRIPADWPVYTNAPSKAYTDMIGGGLAETHGLNPNQSRAYFAGATGIAAPRPTTVQDQAA